MRERAKEKSAGRIAQLDSNSLTMDLSQRLHSKDFDRLSFSSKVFSQHSSYTWVWGQPSSLRFLSPSQRQEIQEQTPEEDLVRLL